MMETNPDNLHGFEQQLRALRPTLPQLPAEQLLYRAGWDAALAHVAGPVATTAVATISKTRQPTANYYWAAACAALVLLSTALGWQVWQQPQPGTAPSIVANPLAAPHDKSAASPAATIASQQPTIPVEDFTPREIHTSTFTNYLELRERVTRGGLTMWPVSTPVRAESAQDTQRPIRDWQTELFREAL